MSHSDRSGFETCSCLPRGSPAPGLIPTVVALKPERISDRVKATACLIPTVVALKHHLRGRDTRGDRRLIPTVVALKLGKNLTLDSFLTKSHSDRSGFETLQTLLQSPDRGGLIPTVVALKHVGHAEAVCFLVGLIPTVVALKPQVAALIENSVKESHSDRSGFETM